MSEDRVVVIGGGLAGLSAAIELADRGCAVTVIEAADRCGGKLASWRDEDGDPIEHGIHGWWPNYVNFLDLMRRVGVPEDALQVPPGSVGILPDGTRFDMRPLLVRLPSPLFLAAHFLRSPVRGLVDLLSVVRAGLGILAFDTRQDFAGLDRFTFKSWLWRLGVSARMYELLFEPYVRSFAFDSAARISAAAVLSSFHLYLVRHQDDILARWLTDDPDRLIIQPMVDYITRHGGRVLTGVRVQRLTLDSTGRAIGVHTSQAVPEDAPHEPKGHDSVARVSRSAVPEAGVLRITTEQGDVELAREGERIVAFGGPITSELGLRKKLHVDFTDTGVVLRTTATAATGVPIARVPLSQIPATGLISWPGPPALMIGRRAGGGFVGLSAECTHMGCTVTWDASRRVMACPCHGATFHDDGAVMTGPAARALASFPTQVEGGDLLILGTEDGAPLFEAEQIILAVDINACKGLLSDRLRELDTFRRIDSLSTTPLLVVRLWFSGRKLVGDLTSGAFVGYPLLDNFFVLSNLQQSFRDSPDTVIEVQAYIVEDEIELPRDRILELVLGDLRRAFPALGVAPRKASILAHKSVFSFHVAGADEYRPDTRTPVPNLYLAGDWVARAAEVWNMERAIVSGKLAAAAVIEDIGGVGPTAAHARLGGWMFRSVVTVVRALAIAKRTIGRVLRGDPRPVRLGPPDHPQWTSQIRFGVVKFRGQVNEQLVTGRFTKVTGNLTVDILRGVISGSGTLYIDLESFDSGIALRDHNVRTVVLGVVTNLQAEFQLLHARTTAEAPSETVFGQELRAEGEGVLTLNRVTRRLPFTARVVLFKEGLLSVRTDEDLVIRPSDFGFDVSRLQATCGAVVDDVVLIGFRLAVPVKIGTKR